MSELLPLSPSQQRIIQISIIGRHHTLLVGPKGVGKSAAIEWFKTLIPASEPLETWERWLRHEGRSEPLSWDAPLRQVGVDVKPAHLLGSWGSHGYRAGELSLAHGGLFVADEFIEWSRDAKECLREPLQTKRVRLTRTRGSIESSCDVQLIATGNLCPCGGLPRLFKSSQAIKAPSCKCSETKVNDYLSKLSGPIIDRLDLVILMTLPASLGEHHLPKDQKIKQNILAAREFAIRHFGNLPSRLDPIWLEKSIENRDGIHSILSTLPSLRSRHKTLRVARSIQALEKNESLLEEHVLEAKTYRLFDLVNV